MLRPNPALEALYQLCQRDKRYALQAYLFVNEAMDYAHQVLGLGVEKPSEGEPAEIEGAELSTSQVEPPAVASAEHARHTRRTGRHVTGQELCEAIRLLALEQFGYLAKTVFNAWGVYTTSDFGEIVYNLIEISQLRKSKDDRREDFDNVFDFETGLRDSFKFDAPEP